MYWSTRSFTHLAANRTLVIAILALESLILGGAGAQSTFGGDAQHTSNYSVAAQNLNAVHWTTAIDLNNTGGYAHYGAPLISPANTIFVPVKTGATDNFQVSVFNAVDGTALYTLSTDYTLPAHNWIPTYQPVLAKGPAGTRLYYPGAGGTVYYIDRVDSINHGTPVQQVFYTTLSSYQNNAANFNSTVFINTPLTADNSGNVFFGFRVQGTAPSPLNTSQSGFARIDPNGNAIYVLASAVANDANIGYDSHNCAPALSNDGSTVYVVVKSSSNEAYGYLLGLDTTTLATKFKVFLKDPRNKNANNARILDDSTASPMVAPDNDVYLGIYGSPSNGSRGFLLRFSDNLTKEKTPGGFGWDNTVAVVPAGMVPSYSGNSSYLLFAKYNNYANAGNDSGDGINRIALLDPNATQVDAHASSNGMLIMREVQTVIGPTPDKENRGASLPYAVREWCINTPAVNPATNSVFMPSEDGHLYRWNLVSNSLDQFLQLNAGVGLPYVPTVIGPDGQVYTLNGGILSAMGNVSGVGIALTSGLPDVRSVVVGQAFRFVVNITNPGPPGLTPTGKVTLTDSTYAVNSPGVLTPTTTTLALNLTLDASGGAVIDASALTVGQHFLTVTYSGDSNFSAGSASLVQCIHAYGTTTALSAATSPSFVGQPLTFTATVASSPSGGGTPTGMVTFMEGSTELSQVPVDGNGIASFSAAGLAAGSHKITAVYASDTNFAASASSVNTVQVVKADTSTALSSSASHTVSSQPVALTATVKITSPVGGVPTGTVTFRTASTTLQTVRLNGSGKAILTTANLPVGTTAITATYDGSPGLNTSVSPVVTQTVAKDGTTTTLMSDTNPSRYNRPVTFTCTVSANSPGTALPEGTVTFKDGNRVLGSRTLVAGSASYTLSTLTNGLHNITAVYLGNYRFLTSTSPILPQMVR